MSDVDRSDAGDGPILIDRKTNEELRPPSQIATFRGDGAEDVRGATAGKTWGFTDSDIFALTGRACCMGSSGGQ